MNLKKIASSVAGHVRRNALPYTAGIVGAAVVTAVYYLEENNLKGKFMVDLMGVSKKMAEGYSGMYYNLPTGETVIALIPTPEQLSTLNLLS